MTKEDKADKQNKVSKVKTQELKDKGATKAKEDAVEEQWWPPFNFDHDKALKSKLCLNLRNCHYDLFRNIALNELGWRIIDHRGRVIEAVPQNKEEKDSSTEHEEEKDNYDGPNIEYLIKNNLARVVPEHNPMDWDIFWADSGMSPEFLSSLASWQRANHFLGMYNICRKSTLGMHLNRFKKEHPDHFNFFPLTWVYPAEFHDIQEYTKKKQEKRKEQVECGQMTEEESEKNPVVLYICKPESGSQGRGIFIA